MKPSNQDASSYIISRKMVFLFACACGLIVGNLYYAQPLISLIAPDIGLSDSWASFIVTLTQIGYCFGLILLVPLGDLLENRGLVVITLCGAVLALFLAVIAPNANWFLFASLLIGFSSVSVQMLIPYAAHFAPEAIRGRIVGNVTSGLLLGIMLSRPASSLIAHSLGWRAVFAISCIVLTLLALILRFNLPIRRPQVRQHYFSLIISLWSVLVETPVLRRRAIYHAGLFASFTLFWTAIPILLLSPTFQLSQQGIALFALAGALGVVAAPIAGRLADKGLTKITTALAMCSVAIAFLLAQFGADSLTLLVFAGILLDMGVHCNLVLGQRAIYALKPEIRSRLNALYMTIFFAGGALGSAVASAAYSYGGWTMVAWIGFSFPCIVLLLFITEII